MVPACVVVLGLVGCQWQLQPSCSVEHVGPEIADAPGERRPAATPEPAMCPGPARTGDSPCFFHDCSAGMYCDDLDTPDCRPGCASDEDCGPRDTCVRSGGGAVGRCEPCAQHTAHAPPPGCVVPSRTGRSRCTGSDCGAGQYCDDAANWSCVPGCASDENCGPSEFCERSAGASVGACRSCFF
ncbi:MAG: hypothetical protein JNK45_18240 [Myxococcales bacterium]|nr:hypothetical protein [Myxococcales bacterium]